MPNPPRTTQQVAEMVAAFFLAAKGDQAQFQDAVHAANLSDAEVQAAIRYINTHGVLNPR